MSAATYVLKDYLPTWHFDPATVRQLKVQRFFGIPVDPPPTKGKASSIIGRLFSNTENRHLWNAYVYTTGDASDSNSTLFPYDRAALARVVVPADWRPESPSSKKVKNRQRFDEVIGDMLRDGSPFDELLPDLAIAGNCFCFTGTFAYGSRKDCQRAISTRGGSCTDNVTTKTDVLVIGSDANSSWAHGSYGNKIEAAMIRRMQFGKPSIIPEAYWTKLLE